MENSEKSGKYGHLLQFGPFLLDADERRLFKNGEPLSLSGKGFDLLLLLVESAGHLKTREELIEALWPTTIVVENNLSWYVGVVRKTLGDEDGSAYIETVRGHGYRFIAPVAVLETTPASMDNSESPPEVADDAPASQAADRSRDEHSCAGLNAPADRHRGGKSRRRTFIAVVAGGTVAIIVALVLVWWLALSESGSMGKKATAPVITVLPFENLSADPGNAYFADGIQDTILSKLAGIGELQVISRTSTEQYASHPANLKQVAAQLGADIVLEGSVQKSGNQVLINVQLIDAQTDKHLWAQVYTRSLADVFAVENDVATRIASSLQAELVPAEAARLASAPTHDPQAYLLFLKANYYSNRITSSNNARNSADTITQAINLYHQAIARDPGFALAWARLSYFESYLHWRQLTSSPQSTDEAERAARQALALDPTLPQARLAMGYVEYYGHQNYAAALAQFEQVHRSLPNNAGVVAAIAYIHRRQGKWQEALSGLQHAMVLDPRNPRRSYDLGFTLMSLREYVQAEQQLDRALALEPQDYEAKALKLTTLLLMGEPLQQMRELLENAPSSDKTRGLILALRFRALLARQPGEASEAIANAPDWLAAAAAIGREPTSLLRAQVWALQGEKKRAQRAFQKARNMLRTALRKRPDNARLLSFLGLAEAGLGHKREALQAGRKAVSLTPVAKDAVAGPSHLNTLAKIYAQVGEPEQAIKLLRRLLAIPAGAFISVSSLERNPIWNPLRHNPKFQALIKEYSHKAPTSQSTTG